MRLVALVPVLFLLAGCGGGSGEDTPVTARTETLTGELATPINWGAVVTSTGKPQVGVTPCTSPVSGARVGATVVVRDAEGETVGLGELTQGLLWVSDPQYVAFTAKCSFGFEVEVPTGSSSFYAVEVADLARADLSAEKLDHPVTLRVK